MLIFDSIRFVISILQENITIKLYNHNKTNIDTFK
jgi:hypothetical protein